MRNLPVRSVVGAALVLTALAVSRTGSFALADTEWKPAVEALTSPAGVNSREPQLTVQGDRTILSWIESAGPRATLKLAERTASGWSEARTVVSGSNLFVNYADVPSVRALADGTLAAHWLQQGRGNPDAYNVRLAFSKDGGRTWSPPTSPHHDGTETEHGFVSLFQAPGAGLGLVWLDGRATSRSPRRLSGSRQHGPARHGVGTGRQAAGRDRDRAARLRMLLEGHRADGGGCHRGVSKPQRQGSAGYLRLSSCGRQMERPHAGAQRWLADKRLPNQWTGGERSQS